jgi:hypothetical protein
VSFLSQTYPGKTHDKNAANIENISYPANIRLHKDTGFQGYEPKVSKLLQPKKAAQERTDSQRGRKQSQGPKSVFVLSMPLRASSVREL